MNKKLNLIFKNKKIYKVFLYFLIFLVINFFAYLLIPKFFNYTPNLIQKSLNKNSNINIKNISNIDYRFFPSPRLSFSVNNLEIEENILEIEDAEIDIILNPLNLINYKTLDYNKFLIKGGLAIIEVKKINQLFDYIKNNNKKIILEESNIILFKENKKFFEINNGLVKINTKNNIQQLNINGLFNNHKISFSLENMNEIKTKIALKIPELDLSITVLLESNNSYKTFKGLVNIEVINNFFQFDFVKKKNITINKGFVRSSLVNSAFEGDLFFKPYFSFDLDFDPTSLDTKKLILILQQSYFSENFNLVEFIKKIDGSINFKNIFNGSIIFKNREIIFNNFNITKNNQLIFDLKVTDFEKKEKIKFNLSTKIRDKKISSKDINIIGYLIPLSSKVIFDQIIFGKEIFTEKKTKEYEKKFKNQIINNSLGNIFNETKIINFLENF